jgi:hypothetical protein
MGDIQEEKKDNQLRNGWVFFGENMVPKSKWAHIPKGNMVAQAKWAQNMVHCGKWAQTMVSWGKWA